MDQRKRLTELLYEAEGQVNNDLPSLEQIADHLLANGVIVPPVKVGDTVWCFNERNEKDVSECKVSSIEFGGCENIVVVNLIIGGYVVPRKSGYYFSEFGKTVFLTKAEAEKALAEGSIR